MLLNEMLVLLFITYLCSCQCDVFEVIQNVYRLRSETIYRDIEEAIASSMFSETNFVRCSYRCSQLRSPSVYFIQTQEVCYCNNAVDPSVVYDSTKPAVIYGYYEHFLEISKYTNFTKRDHFPRTMDCLDLYNAGYTNDGVYTIQPSGQDPVDAWCDMYNGGWTVFQRRQDGSEDFYRGWADYLAGFGNRTGEYWLGLETLHFLTVQESEMEIYMETFGDVAPPFGRATYSFFRIDDETTGYRLNVTGYSSTCTGDVYGWVGNGRSFSTYDNDNDASNDGNCAADFKGAWWYFNCHRCNPNGLYHGGQHVLFGSGVSWEYCWGHYYSVNIAILKVRRK